MENVFQEIVFWTLAVITVAAAVGVVRTYNMFRAALLLVVSFVGIAGIFALLNAEFLAVVQLLVYVYSLQCITISSMHQHRKSLPLQQLPPLLLFKRREEVKRYKPRKLFWGDP